MNKHRYSILLLLLSICGVSYPWTFVYYAVVRRQPDLKKTTKLDRRAFSTFYVIPEISTVDRDIFEPEVILDPTDDIRIHEDSFLAGPIFDFRHVGEKPWWFGIRTAFVKENIEHHGTSTLKTSRAAFDDIFIQAGYNFALTDDWQLALIGAVGLPTKLAVEPHELFNTLAGTRLFSLCPGAEFSYAFINEPGRALCLSLQSRLFHFFTREFTPVIPCGSKLRPGQAVDFLLALGYTHKNHYLEFDYNPTIFVNSAILSPDQTKYGPVVTIHSPYVQYYYTILLPNPNASLLIGGGIEYSIGTVFNRRQFQMWWLFGGRF